MKIKSFFNFIRQIKTLFLLLVSIDLIFITISVIYSIFSEPPNLLNISTDGSYPEIYQYIKEFWIILLILTLSQKIKETWIILWSFPFIYILIDDSFQIHERVGHQIAEKLNFISVYGLRPQDIGELVVTLISAGIIFSIIGYLYIRGTKTFKKTSIDFMIFITLIAFFGVFIDVIHSLVHLGKEIDFILGTIEDGGEMLSVSLTFCYIFHLNNIAETQK